MELVSKEEAAVVVRLSVAEVLALMNICNNTGRGAHEPPVSSAERHMAEQLRVEMAALLQRLRPTYKPDHRA